MEQLNEAVHWHHDIVSRAKHMPASASTRALRALNAELDECFASTQAIWHKFQKHVEEHLDNPAIAVKELLSGSERSFVQFLKTIDELKSVSELATQGISIIPRHIESTASRWPFRSEGAYDDMAPSRTAREASWT